MLALTDRATEMIEGILETPGVPDGAGLRIMPAVPMDVNSGNAVGLQIGVVAEPFAGDSVVEHEGARVFIADEIAPVVDDKTLDADQDGAQVAFSIHPQ
jgi:Fe-S cluster assembly iron-binding protein IscA